MLGYNTIERFLNKIHQSQDKTVDPKYISIWVREILAVNPDQVELDEAEIQICKDKKFVIRVQTVQQLLENIKRFRRDKIFKKST